MKDISKGNNKVITVSRTDYDQNELADLISKSIGNIDITNGIEFKTISKNDIYYIDPNKYTLKLVVANDCPNKSPIFAKSSGLGGYGLNLI